MNGRVRIVFLRYVIRGKASGYDRTIQHVETAGVNGIINDEVIVYNEMKL